MKPPKAKTSFIYRLLDPRDNWIVYIGAAVNPKIRLTDIKGNRNCGRDVGRWATELKNLQLSPILEVIEECPTDSRRLRELKWINHYLDEGYDLLNHDGVERKYGLANRWNNANRK